MKKGRHILHMQLDACEEEQGGGVRRGAGQLAIQGSKGWEGEAWFPHASGAQLDA